jgi:large subunit ribosomal protein L18
MRTLPFKRRHEGKTNYVRRFKLVKSGKTRLVIRRTIKSMIIQFIDFNPNGDKTISTTVSKDIVKHGWTSYTGNVPAAYLTGFLAGKKAIAKKVKEAVLDIGLHTSTKGSRLYSALKGVIDAGVKVNAGKNMFPSAERIHGANVKDAEKVKKEFDVVLKNIEKVK